MQPTIVSKGNLKTGPQYLHELHMSRSVVFSVNLFLSLCLQIMNLSPQLLLSEQSFLSLPLTLPQVLLPVGQLKQNASVYIKTRQTTATPILLQKLFNDIFTPEAPSNRSKVLLLCSSPRLFVEYYSYGHKQHVSRFGK